MYAVAVQDGQDGVAECFYAQSFGQLEYTSIKFLDGMEGSQFFDWINAGGGGRT